MPRLTDFKANIRSKYYQTNTNTIIHVPTPQKASKWTIAPSVGVGYGLTQKQCDVYLGISIGYKIF